MREIEDQCDFDEQCSNNGECNKGKCSCPSNSVQKNSGASYYCDHSCKDNEKMVGDKCVATLALGAYCDSDLCSTGAQCSAKSKKCICACGQVKLDEKNCGPPPKCGDQLLNITYPFSKNAKGDFPFCKIPDSNSSPLLSKAVDECPGGQFCASYMSNLGLCCPLAEKLKCSDGSVAKSKCDPKIVGSCPDDQTCYKSLDTAGSSTGSTFGYVCCKIWDLNLAPLLQLLYSPVPYNAMSMQIWNYIFVSNATRLFVI